MFVPIACPICPSTHKNKKLIKGPYDLGAHLCSARHVQEVSRLDERERTKYETWKTGCSGQSAVEHFLSSESGKRARWAKDLENRGACEKDLPGPVRRVANEGVLTDVGQFGTFLRLPPKPLLQPI